MRIKILAWILLLLPVFVVIVPPVAFSYFGEMNRAILVLGVFYAIITVIFLFLEYSFFGDKLGDLYVEDYTTVFPKFMAKKIFHPRVAEIASHPISPVIASILLSFLFSACLYSYTDIKNMLSQLVINVIIACSAGFSSYLFQRIYILFYLGPVLSSAAFIDGRESFVLQRFSLLLLRGFFNENILWNDHDDFSKVCNVNNVVGSIRYSGGVLLPLSWYVLLLEASILPSITSFRAVWHQDVVAFPESDKNPYGRYTSRVDKIHSLIRNKKRILVSSANSVVLEENFRQQHIGWGYCISGDDFICESGKLDVLEGFDDFIIVEYGVKRYLIGKDKKCQFTRYCDDDAKIGKIITWYDNLINSASVVTSIT